MLLAVPVRAATMITVTPTNLNGWAETTQTGGSYEFVSALDSPLPDEALKLITNSDPNAYIKMQVPQNIALGSITNLKYSTKQVIAADATNGNASFRINLDLDGGGGVDDQLIFEPYYNGFNGSTDWEEYDLLAGKYWSNIARSTYNGSADCGGCAGSNASNFTLQDVLADHANARILAVSVSMGTSNISQQVLVDNVQVNDTTFDFEITAPAVLDGQAPTAPVAIGATSPVVPCGGSTTSFGVTLGWDASSDNVAVTGYEYNVVTPNGTNFTTTVTTNSYTGTFNDGTGAYTYRVRAFDAAGNFSAWSNSCAITYNQSTATLSAKDQCKKDGWKAYGVFKNQGDCVSFVATGGRNKPANASAMRF